MHIGYVAKRTGLTPDAIRFYERKSLLPRPPRSIGGFREYGETDIETLTFIRRIQALGFKLTEVRNLLDLRQTRRQPCAPVHRRLEGKLADVRQKISQLRRLEHELRVALQRCDNELRKRSPHCPILAHGNPGKAK